MSLPALALELFGPVAVAARRSRRYRLLDVDLEQGPSFTLEVKGRAVLVELAARDDTRPAYARTARFDVFARPLLRSTEAPGLGPLERAAVDDAVEALRGAEQALPDFERPVTSRRAEVREVRAGRALVREGEGQYYLNPYVGCMIGCEFCYVAAHADLSRALAGLPSLPWGRWVDVKVDVPEVLAAEVQRLPPGPVRMSPIVTDPYQPLERRYRITRRAVEILVRARFAPVVLTRAARVLEDLDLYASAGPGGAAVGLSVPTDDDRVRARFEPGADPIEERLDALGALRRAGVRTFAVVQPMLPMDPAALAARLADVAEVVRIDRMHVMERALPLYEAAGRLDASEAAFFERLERELKETLARRNVAVDDLDDLHRLLRSS